MKINTKGISLIEVVLVLFIIGMIILMVSNLPSAFSLVGRGSREGKAKEIVLRKIESLRSQTYTNLANGTSIFTDPELNTLPDSSTQLIISDCPVSVCNNNEQLKQVDVKVSWLEKGQTKDVKVTTFISEGGLK